MDVMLASSEVREKSGTSALTTAIPISVLREIGAEPRDELLFSVGSTDGILMSLESGQKSVIGKVTPWKEGGYMRANMSSSALRSLGLTSGDSVYFFKTDDGVVATDREEPHVQVPVDDLEVVVDIAEYAIDRDDVRTMEVEEEAVDNLKSILE